MEGLDFANRGRLRECGELKRMCSYHVRTLREKTGELVEEKGIQMLNITSCALFEFLPK